MLVAAADGWQIDWYTRIGFRPAGTTSVFTRGAGAPTAA
jgi:hypothetical protein